MVLILVELIVVWLLFVRWVGGPIQRGFHR